MADDDFELDRAARAVADARGWQDEPAEALALTVLAQSLLEAERSGEAAYFHRLAAETGRRAGNRRAQAEALMRRGTELEARLPPDRRDSSEAYYRRQSHRYKTSHAYQEAASIFAELAAPEAEQARLAAVRTGLSEAEVSGLRIGPREVEVLGVGFVALKVLGPFADAFATRLGELAGESAARALGRLRLLRVRATGAQQLDVPVSTSRVCRLLLPEDLTDEARLAIIDLDATAFQGTETVLEWDTEEGRWRPIAVPAVGRGPVSRNQRS